MSLCEAVAEETGGHTSWEWDGRLTAARWDGPTKRRRCTGGHWFASHVAQRERGRMASRCVCQRRRVLVVHGDYDGRKQIVLRRSEDRTGKFERSAWIESGLNVCPQRVPHANGVSKGSATMS